MPEEIDGHAIETIFLQELKAINAYFRLGYDIFYWRTPAGVEVDFVLYGEKGIRAFELKRTSKPSSSLLKGLKAFLTDYPKSKAYFIYGGERRMRELDIEILPIKEVLKELPKILA